MSGFQADSRNKVTRRLDSQNNTYDNQQVICAAYPPLCQVFKMYVRKQA